MSANSNPRAEISKCLQHRDLAKLLSLSAFWRAEHLHPQCPLSRSFLSYYCTPTALPTEPNGPLCPRGVWRPHTFLPQPWNDWVRERFLNAAILLYTGVGEALTKLSDSFGDQGEEISTPLHRLPSCEQLICWKQWLSPFMCMWRMRVLYICFDVSCPLIKYTS